MASAQIDAARELATQIEALRWDGGVRIVLQGSMRAVRNENGGGIDMESGWRADVYYGAKQRKPSFVLVADTPRSLLNDLASLAVGDLQAAG